MYLLKVKSTSLFLMPIVLLLKSLKHLPPRLMLLSSFAIKFSLYFLGDCLSQFYAKFVYVINRFEQKRTNSNDQ